MSTAGLDNLTPARTEGLQQFVGEPARTRPESLSHKQIRRLGECARADYDRRREWHANLGPLQQARTGLSGQARFSCHCWLAPPLAVHCTTCAPSLVAAPETSATSPLSWLTMV